MLTNNSKIAMKMNNEADGDSELEMMVMEQFLDGNERGRYDEKLILQVQAENSQLKRELARCEARQSKLYYHLEQQLDIWLNEKASLQSSVDGMHDHIMLSAQAIQGILSSDPSSLPPAHSESCIDAFGTVQGSQGLVEPLLDLGEAFLASKLDEESFRELQTKLVAALTRDKNIIQHLQQKIGELSEMGAMVTKLKHELREEKEKAQEEAEDLTQEMAELRYQLMEMLDQERELRSNVEHASLRRIAELEEQLKQTRQDVKAAVGVRQTAEVQAVRRGQEIHHLKSVIQEIKQKCTSLEIQKQEMEQKLLTRLQELQAKNNSLEADLLKWKEAARQQLLVSEEKLIQLMKTCTSFKEESSVKVSNFKHAEVFLQHGVTEIQQLLADFKCQLVLLAEVYQNAKVEQKNFSGLHDLFSENSNLTTMSRAHGLPKDGICDKNYAIYAGEKSNSVELEGNTDAKVKELPLQVISSHTEQDLKERSSFNVEDAENVDTDNLVSTNLSKEEVLENPCTEEGSICGVHKEEKELEGKLHALCALSDNLELQVTRTSDKHEISLQTPGKKHDPSTASLIASEKKEDWPWVMQEIVEIVESVTEELIKLFRVVLKSSLSAKYSFLSPLELHLQYWSNLSQKALPGKLARRGAIREWGNLVIDLVGQSHREILAMQHKLKDLEIEIELNESKRAERITLSEEVTCLKEDMITLEDRHTFKITRREEEKRILGEQLEHACLSLLEAQKKIIYLEETGTSLHGTIRRLELESERSKSAWLSEKQRLEMAMIEYHDNFQKEKVKRFEEVDKLEKRMRELVKRLASNEHELNELIEIGCIDMDSTIATKLRWLEQKLDDSQKLQESLQAERAELASQVVWLQAKYEEAQQELQLANEQHVEILIRYEEEHASMEMELETMKRTLQNEQTVNKQVSAEKANHLQLNANTILERQITRKAFLELQNLLANKEEELQLQNKLQNETEQQYRELCRSAEEALCSLSLAELDSSKNENDQLQRLFHSAKDNLPSLSDKEQVINCYIKKLKEKFQQQNHLLERQKGEMESLKQANEELSKRAAGFESESLALCQQVLVLESQTNEMQTTIVNLQEALLLENLKMAQDREDYNLQTQRCKRQEEDNLRLQIKSNELFHTLSSLQTNLGETRKKEREAQDQVKRLELELSVAKEEVVKSEVRIQRILKQAQDEVDAERRRVDAASNAQKQMKWFLEKQLGKLESTQSEKSELLAKTENLKKSLECTEKERDDLKVAYAELENQFARRTAFTK